MTLTQTATIPRSGASSTLGALRSLIPQRQISFRETLSIAELQATRLVSLLQAGPDGVREHHIAGLPRIRISYQDLPVSGTSHWNGTDWIITISNSDSAARQRFTLLHEYKHIIDHGRQDRLYAGTRSHRPAEQAELAADYFAGCVLVSKRALKWAWGSGIQQPAELADHFGVSRAAIRVRLAQTGLDRLDDRRLPSRCYPSPSANHHPSRAGARRYQT